MAKRAATSTVLEVAPDPAASDVLVRVRSAVPSLQPAERRVAAPLVGNHAGAALLKSTDVAIGISHSGATSDTIEPLQVAAGHGARTIALTNFAASPITSHAGLILTTAVRETPFRSGATASRIAQLAMIDCMFVGVAQLSYEQPAGALSSTHDAIRHRRLYPSVTRRTATGT